MIIGLCGLKGSGKDTLGKILVEKYNFQKFSFADTLKDITSIIFNWDRKSLEGDTNKSREFRETKDDWWSQQLDKDITPRKMLQFIGTDLFRNYFHQDIWVKIIERKLIDNKNKNIVITDCRFMNEVEIIKKLRGSIIKINRNITNNDNHSSENQLTNLKPDYVIDNNKDIANLYSQIKKIIEEI